MFPDTPVSRPLNRTKRSCRGARARLSSQSSVYMGGEGEILEGSLLNISVIENVTGYFWERVTLVGRSPRPCMLTSMNGRPVQTA